MAWVLSVCIIFCCHTLRATAPASQLYFMENKGQVRLPDGSEADEVLYTVTTESLSIFIFRNGISYQVLSHAKNSNNKRVASDQVWPQQEETALMPSKEVHRFEMRFMETSSSATVIAQDPAPYYENYYLNNTAITHVRSFSAITIRELYPGIDWVIYLREGVLKYDLIVHPGADPEKIRWEVNGTRKIRCYADQSITYSTRLGTITDRGLMAFQEDTLHTVDARFGLLGNKMHIVLGNYDRSKELTIDPILDWSTLYGGLGEDAINGMTVDADGNILFTGYTASSNAMAYLGYQNTYSGGTYDAYIVKMDASGNRIWATYFGGSKGDFGTSVSTNVNNEVYVSGFSYSVNIPTTVGAFQPAKSGDYDAFLVKLDASGALIFSTYYGGAGAEFARSVAVDMDQNVYIAGSTTSNAGIASGGWQMAIGGNNDEFVAKFNGSGNLLWATYLGGPAEDYCRNVNVDGNNNVFLAGYSNSSTGIAYNAFDATWQSNYDCTLAKYTASGTLLWSTYYGGNGEDNGNAVAFDADNNAYLAMQTATGNGLAFNGFQMTNGGSVDAMVAKFSTSGNRLWATYYGGNMEDMAKAIRVNGNAVYVAGHAMSSGLGLDGYDLTLAGLRDGFCFRLDTAGALVWSTYAGGSADEYGRTLALLDNNTIVWGGKSFSNDYPASAGAYQTVYGGGVADAFLQKVTDCTLPVTYYADNDNDGFGDASFPVIACSLPPGFAVNNLDCNDANPVIYPFATESCNFMDDDCDGLTDDADAPVDGQTSWFADIDTDLYGSTVSLILACNAPAGYISTGGDCNDGNAAVYPGAPEVCNTWDDDCDGIADEDIEFVNYYQDTDGDGFGRPDVYLPACAGIPAGYAAVTGDCNDGNAFINPFASEICNSLDDDCDALIDEEVVTAFATASGPTTFCKGSNVTLLANTGAGYNYQWRKNGLAIAGATNFTYVAYQSGSYSVAITLTGGCSALSSAITVTVNVKPNPVITAAGSLDICATGSVQLKVKNKAGDTYQWFKDGVSIAGATSNVYFATAIGSYYIRQTSPAGCFKNSAPVTVTSSCRSGADGEFEWWIIPNPATTHIDVFIDASGLSDLISVRVVNMLGEVITNSLLAVTEGNINMHMDLPKGIAEGTYFVILETTAGRFTRQILVSG